MRFYHTHPTRKQEMALYIETNKPKGLKVAKEELRLIGSIVDRLDGR